MHALLFLFHAVCNWLNCLFHSMPGSLLMSYILAKVTALECVCIRMFAHMCMCGVVYGTMSCSLFTTSKLVVYV